MLAGPSRWGQAPGRSTAHGHCLAGPVDPVRIPPLALDPYLVEQRYHRQHLRIFGVSNFVILDACLRPDQCWGVLAGLCACQRFKNFKLRCRSEDDRQVEEPRPSREKAAGVSQGRSLARTHVLSADYAAPSGSPASARASW